MVRPVVRDTQGALKVDDQLCIGVHLRETEDKSIGFESTKTRSELVDAEGVAMTDLRPSGVGVFNDERIDVVSESEWIEEGTPVRIVSAEGSRNVVRPINTEIDKDV